MASKKYHLAASGIKDSHYIQTQRDTFNYCFAGLQAFWAALIPDLPIL